MKRNLTSSKNPRWVRVLRIVAWLLLGSLGLIVISVYIFVLYGLNFEEPGMEQVWETGFQEHTFVIEETTINYVEGPDNGPPLLLIHGQLGLWQSYQRVLPELSQHFHVFALDCHGHGKSSRTPDGYSVQAMGMDFETFIEEVIGEPAIVSGNSSGGLLALWLAANSAENVPGIVLEDPPLFSSEYPRIRDTFAWDTMETAYGFLQQSSEDDFLNYYLLNSRLMSMFGSGQQGIYNWVQFYRRERPESTVEVFFLPLSLRGMFIGMTMYDPHFGEAFYDGSWHRGFDHAEVLSRVECPAVLIHANWSYDDDGILMGAMDADDASRANALMANSRLVRVDSGHVVHIEDPSVFIDIMIDFGNELSISGD